ncbi:ig-like domain-containing protein [Caerostris extrusa]|uniref:Ig-like domain-containing protein n=1 Tax=Caerostris extrusa TaxID=172846 RepID=A0AAV4T3K2_CAEEX|nr:ig-like domain-containing protein [Caerostris extrusa]
MVTSRLASVFSTEFRSIVEQWFMILVLRRLAYNFGSLHNSGVAFQEDIVRSHIALITWTTSVLFQVPQQHITRMGPLRHPNGLLSSMLGLRFVVVPQHLKNGVLTLSCRAYISKAYLTTKSEIVATNKAKIAENHATLNQDGPSITGGRLRYQEGNVVNVNCTAMKKAIPLQNLGGT